MQFENSWWGKTAKVNDFNRRMKKRPYFNLFYPMVTQKEPNRALVLMGPRRVGKTVMIHQAIQKLLDSGVESKSLIYISAEHPIYSGLGLEDLFKLAREASETRRTKGFIIFFDEIQYLKNWEIHLKSLVDSYRDDKFVVSGSAAAALKLKSIESGAGRFTEFSLPPLTFYEFMHLVGKTELVEESEVNNDIHVTARDIGKLNQLFLDYINFGGYPEAVFSETIRLNPYQYIKSDIIDKVLLRDLPGLYGIQDIRELNSLFTNLAFNTANEVSLEKLSQSSGVAKNTIKKYIEYLEAAFLIKVVNRIDRDARQFKRANYFKVYLTNPSLYAALFQPVTIKDEMTGFLVETAIFAQRVHPPDTLFTMSYARWKKGEVDIVHSYKGKPVFAAEIKWSDHHVDNLKELRNLIDFCHIHNIPEASVTTFSIDRKVTIENVKIAFIPASLYCYQDGLVSSRKIKKPDSNYRAANP